MASPETPKIIDPTPQGLVIATNHSLHRARPLLNAIGPLKDIGESASRFDRPFLRHRGSMSFSVLEDGSLSATPHLAATFCIVHNTRNMGNASSEVLSDGQRREEVVLVTRDENLMLEVNVRDLKDHPAVEGLDQISDGKVRFRTFALSTSGISDDPEARVIACGELVVPGVKEGPRVIFNDIHEADLRRTKATDPSDAQGHEIRARVIGAFDGVVDVLLKAAEKSTEKSRSAELIAFHPPIKLIRKALQRNGQLAPVQSNFQWKTSLLSF